MCYFDLCCIYLFSSKTIYKVLSSSHALLEGEGRVIKGWLQDTFQMFHLALAKITNKPCLNEWRLHSYSSLQLTPIAIGKPSATPSHTNPYLELM